MLQDAVGTSSLYGLLEELDKFMHERFTGLLHLKTPLLVQEILDLQIAGS